MKIILMIGFSFFVPFIYYYKNEKRVPWNEVTTCAVLIFIFSHIPSCCHLAQMTKIDIEVHHLEDNVFVMYEKI